MGPSTDVLTVDYSIQVGGLRASASDPLASASLIQARVDRGMDGHVGRALLRLHPFEQDLPAPGDPVTIELDGGEGAATVFTGEVSLARVTAQGLEVLAADGLSRAGQHEVEGLFEEQTVGAIVKDLLGRAGAEPGEIEDGPTLPRVALHAGVRALQHLRALAELASLDLWTDGEGKVHLAAPAEGGADESLTWGETLLALDLCQAAAAPDGWAVWGEGAAGTKGKDRAHWLATDLSNVKGSAAITREGAGWKVEAGAAGARSTRRCLGLVRSAELAEALARAAATARAARPVLGTLDALGAPSLEPGQRIAVSGLPADHASGALADRPLRVRAVRHTLDGRGLLTRLVL